MANSLLKISNNQVLYKFIHDCVDDLTGRKQVNFDSYSSDIEWTNEDYASALNFVQNLYRENVQSPRDDLSLKIQELGPKIQQCLKDCYEIRRQDILQAVIKESLCKSGRPLAENVDWKLKWVMGSSKLASLREPLLQVDLHCFKMEGEAARRTVNFEMNLGQVDKLITDLERVRNELKIGLE